MVGAKIEQMPVAARTAQERRGFAGYLAVVGGGGAMKARLWNSLPKHTESCRGCREVEVEGLASPVDGYLQKCDGEAGRVTACLRAGVAVGVVRAARVVEEVEGNLVVKPMKANTLAQHCLLTHTGEVTLEDARAPRYGKSSAFPRSAAKACENRRMVSGLATQAR